MTQINGWYARTDERGGTEWDSVTQDDFDRWALCGGDRDEVFDVDVITEQFVENMIYLAQAEERHIPYSTREEFLDECRRFVKAWNKRRTS